MNEQSCLRANWSLMNPRMSVAVRAAREAGALLRSMLGTDLSVRSKDVLTNLVTEADTRSEALIRSIIADAFPDDAILGEETGATGDDRAGRWIVDPLDGTTNYAHGYRCFCVSIAYERDGAVERRRDAGDLERAPGRRDGRQARARALLLRRGLTAHARGDEALEGRQGGSHRRRQHGHQLGPDAERHVAGVLVRRPAGAHCRRRYRRGPTTKGPCSAAEPCSP